MNPPAGAEERADPPANSIRTMRQALGVFASKRGVRKLAAFAGGAIAARALAGPIRARDAGLAGGVVGLWAFQEWAAHKHLLHLKPAERADGSVRDPMFARAHRYHHAHPHVVDGILLPEEVIHAAMPATVALWWLVTPDRRSWLTGLASYATMAVVYEWTHFIVHTGVKPRTAYGERVRRNHQLHHHRSEQHWYAFVAPFVDAMMGTDPPLEQVARSRTVRDLHGLGAPAR